MRVLFTTMPLSGHFHPLLPVARALVAVGHEVTIAAPASFRTAVEHSGFRHAPAGYDGAPAVALPQLRTLTGPERAAFVAEELFAGLRPRHLVPDLLALATTWLPDLIVREEREYGGCIAAECLGLPHATVGIDAGGDHLPPDRIAAPLNAIRAAHGLPPDPDLAMLQRYLTLRFFPPVFQNPALVVTRTTHYLRPTPDDRSGPEGLPAWVETLPARPLVYVGLGTVFNEPAVFRALLAGLRDEALTLIVTVGRDQDPAAYGPQPENVHIVRYLPLSLLLPRCDLVVTNGGSGTLMAALACGLPAVVVPISADQPLNAARIVALGLGQTIPRAALTPESARQAVHGVLANPTYRQNAERLRAEMAALPGPEHSVTLLERLAQEKQPILVPTIN